MINIRRGITRLGAVLLVLWELQTFYFWATDQSAPTRTYVHAAIVPPLVVGVCWRTLLWVVRGFVSERAR